VPRYLFLPNLALALTRLRLFSSLPGDYGFDPLFLGEQPETLRWYAEAERVHARFAMLGVAGVLAPELLTNLGLADLPNWVEVQSSTLWASTGTLFLVQMILFSFAEHKRLYDFKNPGSQAQPGSFLGLEVALGGSGVAGYPGGIFDPMGLGKGKDLAELKQKEIKNGRLAMVAFAGFIGQYYSTGETPLANLAAHLADPWHVSVVSNATAIPHLI